MWQVNYHVQLLKGFSPLFLRKGKAEKKSFELFKGCQVFQQLLKTKQASPPYNPPCLHWIFNIKQCPFSHWKNVCARKVKHTIFNYITLPFLLWQLYHYLGSCIKIFTSLNKKFLPCLINEYLGLFWFFFPQIRLLQEACTTIASEIARACLFAQFRTASFYLLIFWSHVNYAFCAY